VSNGAKGAYGETSFQNGNAHLEMWKASAAAISSTFGLDVLIISQIDTAQPVAA
jgi:hypothetical protein